MGQRALFEVFDYEGRVVARLFTHNSHPYLNPEAEFIKRAKLASGPSNLVRELLQLRYNVNGGNHSGGDYVFTVSSSADFESLYQVRWPSGGVVRDAEVMCYQRRG